MFKSTSCGSYVALLSRQSAEVESAIFLILDQFAWFHKRLFVVFCFVIFFFIFILSFNVNVTNPVFLCVYLCLVLMSSLQKLQQSILRKQTMFPCQPKSCWMFTVAMVICALLAWEAVYPVVILTTGFRGNISVWLCQDDGWGGIYYGNWAPWVRPLRMHTSHACWGILIGHGCSGKTFRHLKKNKSNARCVLF